MKEYSNEELTVYWNKEKCIHSAKCAKGLSQVFKPKNRPWIDVNAASSDAIMAQIDQCPSGALSYKNKASATSKKGNDPVDISLVANGPLLVNGSLKVSSPDGSSEKLEGTTAFCRCGHSRNKPFCDGSHNDSEFEG